MNAMQRISHELKTERLAAALGLEHWRQMRPAEIRERWWRRTSMGCRAAAERARTLPEEASVFRFHSME